MRRRPSVTDGLRLADGHQAVSHLGRKSVPPSVVGTVMVLQRLGGLSDREAVERYSFDARWRFVHRSIGTPDPGGKTRGGVRLRE